MISYSGADPSLNQDDFNEGDIRVRRYRNRRIGDYLKELSLTEGRGTGIPAIRKSLRINGSADPVFDIDDPNRSYFVIDIPMHPDFIEETKTDDATEDISKDEVGENRLVEGLVEGLVESQQKMVLLMDNNPSVSIKEMADSIGISTTAVDKNITALKQRNIIERVGSDSKGLWQINFPQED
jgi:ATP-dependent DNA helicase RecG